MRAARLECFVEASDIRVRGSDLPHSSPHFLFHRAPRITAGSRAAPAGCPFPLCDGGRYNTVNRSWGKGPLGGRRSGGESHERGKSLTDKAQATEDGQAKADGTESLTVTDNRTGETYEMEITDGTVRAMDFREIKVNDDDFGLMTHDPGLSNTSHCRSSICYIGGEEGVLEYRGIPIEQLCEHSNYLEVAYLLMYGHLPTQAEYDDWVYQVTHHTYVHENIKEFMDGFRHDADPMGMLLASVGALSTFYPEAKDLGDDFQQHVSAVRLIAKVPTLAAFAYRHSLGLPYVYPDNALSYTGNFLSMLFKMTEPRYEPDPRLERALDVLFILHADHEQNCSTAAVRTVGSALPDPFTSIAAGVAGLYGPLHGGANIAVVKMLQRIESTDNVQDFLGGVKEGNERLMGFGHRVYKNYDPRARIIQEHIEEVLEATGKQNPLLQIAQELEKRAMDDEYFTGRKLYPNVDFYSGVIYEALNIPQDMFTVMFAIPRTSGWMAQWMEWMNDEELRIVRPRQIYTGPRDVDYVPINERDGSGS
jgi:citrate synthase